MVKTNSASAGETARTPSPTAPLGAPKRVSKQGFEDFLRAQIRPSAAETARLAMELGPARLPQSADWAARDAGLHPDCRGVIGLHTDRRGQIGLLGSKELRGELDADGLGAAERGETTKEWSDPEGSAGACWQGLDPLLRVLANTVPVSPAPAPSNVVVSTHTLDAIAQQLIKRLSVGKTASGGAVRLELGAGPYAGTGLVLTSDGSRVGVGLDGEGDTESRQLVSRLVERLRARGMDAHAS